MSFWLPANQPKFYFTPPLPIGPFYYQPDPPQLDPFPRLDSSQLDSPRVSLIFQEFDKIIKKEKLLLFR